MIVLTVYLRSTTIVTWLTEYDDIIKPLLRGAPRLGLALALHLLGPALLAVYTKIFSFRLKTLFCLQKHLSKHKMF